MRKLIKENLEKLNLDYSGEYEDLYNFINDNDLQEKFVDLFNKYNDEITISNWDDFVRGEMGTDEEIISELVGNDYRIFYDEDDDTFIIKKRKKGKLNFKIKISNSDEIIEILDEIGIFSEYKPRFVVTINDEIIGGSTYEIDGDNVYNFDIGILDEYQGYGISKKLIDIIIKDAKNMNSVGLKAQVVNNVLFEYLISLGFRGSVDNGVKYVFKKIYQH
jgi:hypothetical protein